MTLPLIYLRPRNSCPFRRRMLTHLICLGFASSERIAAMTDSWQRRALGFEMHLKSLRDQARESGGPDPLRPYSTFSHPQLMRDGEVIQVPSLVTNPQIYEWGIVGAGMLLPWYLGYLAREADADDAFNAQEHLTAELTRRLRDEGIPADIDCHPALLWMLHSGRARRFQGIENIRDVIEVVGEHWLMQFIVNGGENHLKLAAHIIMNGIKYEIEKGRTNGTTDV